MLMSAANRIDPTGQPAPDAFRIAQRVLPLRAANPPESRVVSSVVQPPWPYFVPSFAS